jgi:hypothetical protein
MLATTCQLTAAAADVSSAQIDAEAEAAAKGPSN